MLILVSYCLLFYLVSGIGTSMGYHRILTHKSAKLPKWLEYFIVLMGLPAGTPIQWVGNHRAHHGFADQEGDPHSPHIGGFWYAHCGWYINSKNRVLCFLYAVAGPLRMLFDAFWRPRTNQENTHLAADISQISFYKNLSRPIIYQSIVIIYLAAILSSALWLFDLLGIAIIWILLVFIYNLGDSIDSLGHLYGRKVGESEARNNAVLGWLSFGDGWHGNHHNNPTLAKHGLTSNQFDLTFLLLKGLEKLGFAKKIQE